MNAKNTPADLETECEYCGADVGQECESNCPFLLEKEEENK